MKCNVMLQACDGFLFYSWKTPETEPKNWFSGSERFLVNAPLHPMSYAPIFCQTKRLMEVNNCGKFY